MRSRARIGSHPLHPMLVSFPVALLTTALLADLAGHYWDGAGHCVAASLALSIRSIWESRRTAVCEPHTMNMPPLISMVWP